jgi:glc operon protein GlcG
MEITSQKIVRWVDDNISSYMENPDDYKISEGNVALCIVEKDGTVYGKMFGKDLIRKRNSFFYAWKKASQVWITGIPTGEFERKVFNNEINEYAYGINRPDYIGWIGGQPVTIGNGEILAVAFSGFRGETDIQLISDAIKEIMDK